MDVNIFPSTKEPNSILLKRKLSDICSGNFGSVFEDLSGGIHTQQTAFQKEGLGVLGQKLNTSLLISEVGVSETNQEIVSFRSSPRADRCLGASWERLGASWAKAHTNKKTIKKCRCSSNGR